MGTDEVDNPEMGKWDPAFTEQLYKKAGPFIRKYFRAEVRGIESVPAEDGALIVSNHSGGMMALDVPIFGGAFYDKFGYDRPLYTLAHNQVLVGPFKEWLGRAGIIHASQVNAASALRSGAVVLVFPGGDHDSYRPTLHQNVIDFHGRKGYVKTAIDTGVPIVPVVSIGGQETQFFLTRGNWLAKRVGLKRLRVEILPISIGFPFGLTTFLVPNFPLPAKIVTQVLKPVDVLAEFGKDPDIEEVDAHVRKVMQSALDWMARKRRFPILG